MIYSLKDSELYQEIKRIQEEEGAISLVSSHSESMDEKSGRWLEKKQGNKKTKKRVHMRSPILQVSKEGATDLPLICLSDWFQTLDAMTVG